MKRLLPAVLLLCAYASAQQINPNQIQPSPSSNQVLTTVTGGQAPSWQPSATGVNSFNTRTGAVVPQTGDYTAAMVTNAADVTASNNFLQYQYFTGGAQLGNGDSSAVIVNSDYLNFEGNTIEFHFPSTGDIFAPVSTATSSNNYGSMEGPNLEVSYWTGTAVDTGVAYPRVTCGTGNNPACVWTIGWAPDNHSPPVGGTATLTFSLPYQLTVPNLYDTAGTTIGDCWLVGAGGQLVQGPCTSGGVNASSLQGVPISATPPTNGYILGYNGTDWLPISPAAAAGAVELTSATTQTVAQATATTLAVNNFNNLFYASQYQTGGGNNGIANAVALNSGAGENVAVDAGYAATEVIPGQNNNVYTAIPAWPTKTHVTDARAGLRNDYYTLSGSVAQSPLAEASRYYFNTYDVNGPTLVFPGFVDQLKFEGIGQQIVGFGGVNLKSYFLGDEVNMIATAQGQKLMHQDNLQCNGVGDCINLTRFTFCGGGTNGAQDEGCHDTDTEIAETHAIATGTISSIGSGTLQTSISAGAGEQGDGRYLGDTTKAVTCAYPSCYTTGDNNFPPSPTIWGENGQVPPMATLVGTSYAPSILVMGCTTAFGGSCPNNSSTNPSGQLQSAAGTYAPGTLTVNLVTVAPGLPTAYATTTSGLSAYIGLPCTVADSQYIEQAIVTAVPSSTTITIAFNKPHTNGFTIACGGYAGYGIEDVGATTTLGGVTYQQVWPVVGTLDATHLLVWDHNSQQNWSRSLVGNNTQGQCQSDTMGSISVTGSVVSFLDTSGINPLFYNQSNVLIATANGTYNGTFSTTVGVGSLISYTLGSAPSGATPTTGTMTYCNTSVNLYPMAEVADVLNPSTSAVDGYFKLALSNMTADFSSGDSVTEFHYPAMQIGGEGRSIFAELPAPPLTGESLDGLRVGDNFTGYAAHDLSNITASAKYQGYGGSLAISGAFANQIDGMFYADENITTAPDNAVISVPNCKASPIGCGNPSLSPFAIFRGNATPETFYSNPYLGSIDFGGPIRLNYGTNSMTMYSPTYGTFAFSKDQNSSPTADANLQASTAQFTGAIQVGSCTGCGSSAPLSLTTTGSSGPATLAGSALNIPNYSGGTPGGSPGNLQYNNTGVFGGDTNTNDDGAGNLTAASYTATGGTGQVAGTEGTAPSGASGKDILWADSTAHRWKMNNNNAGALTFAGVASAGTSGHCVEFASNGIDLADAGAACGSGGGGLPTATAPGQIITATAAGTTYAAQGNIFYQQSTDTIASIEAACSSLCTYVVTSPQTITLSSNHTLNANVNLYFMADGEWTVNGAFTLTIPATVGGTITQHFAGSSTIAFGAMQAEANVEWFGAVGGATLPGTDSTTAIQACLNAITYGQCVLQAEIYKTTAALSITKSYVGLRGVKVGRGVNTVIESTSATADILDVTGTSGAYVNFGVFENFTLARSVIPTGTTDAGFSESFVGGTTVRNVVAVDSHRDFYLHAAPSYGTGGIFQTDVDWSLGETTGTFYGYYLDSADGVAENSILLRDTAAGNPSEHAGPTYWGYYLTGKSLNDVEIADGATAGLTYGAGMQTISGFTNGGTDVHFDHCIMDSFTTSAYYFNAVSGPVTINGGWIAPNGTPGTPLVDIEGSTNITLTGGLQIVNASTAEGVLLNFANSTASSYNTVANVNFGNSGNPAVVMTNSGNNVVQGITVHGTGTTAKMISLVGSSNNTIASNNLSGTALVGINLDSNSKFNTGLETNTIQSTITTAISNGAVTNNPATFPDKVVSGSAGETSYFPFNALQGGTSAIGFQDTGTIGFEGWSNATPTDAYALGFTVPGGTAGTNPTFSYYAGSWAAAWSINSATGAMSVNNALTATSVNGALLLSGTTGTITGTSLTATCDSGTATVTGAVVGHPVSVSSTTGVDVGGAFNLRASVTATNTVTVYVCGTGTPSSLAYNVTVF